MYGMLRWPDILSVEHRRTGPSNLAKVLAGCKLYADPFARFCQ